MKKMYNFIGCSSSYSNSVNVALRETKGKEGQIDQRVGQEVEANEEKYTEELEDRTREKDFKIEAVK